MIELDPPGQRLWSHVLTGRFVHGVIGDFDRRVTPAPIANDDDRGYGTSEQWPKISPDLRWQVPQP